VSILYQVLRPVVTIAVHVFYKKIEIANREHLNEEGATLIVSNHNNAFLDAVVVEMFAKNQIYSIARGDVFGNPFIRSILNQMRILPIFRKEEGPGQMHKNEATFERCIELLRKKEHIIMYPEGDCVMEKRLRRLRKGAARIALRTEAKHDFKLNLRILPVGLNYSSAKKFRSKLFINIGNPI
jgi:1-acyl-sn-glycerol-3-phosphate acyltransferase